MPMIPPWTEKAFTLEGFFWGLGFRVLVLGLPPKRSRPAKANHPVPIPLTAIIVGRNPRHPNPRRRMQQSVQESGLMAGGFEGLVAQS